MGSMTDSLAVGSSYEKWTVGEDTSTGMMPNAHALGGMQAPSRSASGSSQLSARHVVELPQRYNVASHLSDYQVGSSARRTSRMYTRSGPGKALGSMMQGINESRMRRTSSLPDLSTAPWKDAPRVTRRSLLQLPAVPKRAVFDEAAGDAFGHKVVGMVNDSSTCVLISIGHQLGLFSAMAKLNDRPRSAATIAKMANGLRPRYVQEWLHAMTCAGIVDQTTHGSASGLLASAMDMGASHPLITRRMSTAPAPEDTYGTDGTDITRKYRLPAEHALFLTWEPGSDNLALLAQYVPVLGRVTDDVVECFRTGRGLDWTKYGQFDLVTELDSMQTVGPVDRFERETLSLVPGLVDELRDGISVLCLGSGLGTTLLPIAQAYSKSWFTSYDLSAARSASARAETNKRSDIGNMHFNVLSSGRDDGTSGDGRKQAKAGRKSLIEEEHCYEVAIILDGSIIRDSTDPHGLLASVFNALRPGRSLIYFEYLDEHASSAAPLLYSMSALQSVPLGLNAGGPALGRLWGAESATRALNEVGFQPVHRYNRDCDSMNCVIVARSPQDLADA